MQNVRWCPPHSTSWRGSTRAGHQRPLRARASGPGIEVNSERLRKLCRFAPEKLMENPKKLGPSRRGIRPIFVISIPGARIPTWRAGTAETKKAVSQEGDARRKKGGEGKIRRFNMKRTISGLRSTLTIGLRLAAVSLVKKRRRRRRGKRRLAQCCSMNDSLPAVG